jgi:hypothetical protein
VYVVGMGGAGLWQEFEVSNDELRTVREAMRELNRLVESLERGESEKFVLTKNGQMRAVVLSVEGFAGLRETEARRLAVVPDYVVHPGLLGGWVVSKPPAPRRTPDEAAR